MNILVNCFTYTVMVNVLKFKHMSLSVLELNVVFNRAGIDKMLVRIANREAVRSGSALFVYALLVGN